MDFAKKLNNLSASHSTSPFCLNIVNIALKASLREMSKDFSLRRIYI